MTTYPNRVYCDLCGNSASVSNAELREGVFCDCDGGRFLPPRTVLDDILVAIGADED